MKCKMLQPGCRAVRWVSRKRENGLVKASLVDLYEHFEQLGECDYDDLNVNEYVDLYLDIKCLNNQISAEEIFQAVKRLKTNKSPGIDKIVNEYIKASVNIIMPLYVYNFNKVLDSGDIPGEWTCDTRY